METIHILLLLGLGIVFIVVIVAMRKKESSSAAKPQERPVDLSSLTIKDARARDIVTIHGAGADFEDLTFRVDEVHRYEWGNDSWYELEGQSPKGRVFLEWADDGGLEVSLTDPGKSLRIQELGLSEEQLAQFDEEQSAANGIEFEGVPFHYESSHEVGFFEQGQGEGEGFYLWNFTSGDGKRTLAVEKWEGEAFEASFASKIDPADVQILRG